MSATPSSRRQTTTTTTDDIEIPPLPPYQPPIAPLIPNCQQKLTNLAKSSALKHLHTHIQHAAEKLTDSAGDVNERLTEVREKALRSRKRNRAQFEDGQQDGDGNRGEENEENEEDHRLQKTEQEVKAVTAKLEEGIRRIVDAEFLVDGLSGVLTDLSKEAEQDAAASTISASTSTARRLRRRLNPHNDSEEEEEDDDDEPSQSQPQPQPPTPYTKTLTQKLKTEAANWSNQSLTQRYSTNNTYIGFYRMVHDAKHPGNDIPPLPHASTWFRHLEGAGSSNQTPREGSESDGDGDSGPRAHSIQPKHEVENDNENEEGEEDEEEEEEEEEELEIASERISLKCPLTLLTFQEPVTSTKCPHSFEKQAILDMISHSSTTVPPSGGGRNRVRAVKCPVCSVLLTAQDLRKDAVLLRRVRRMEAMMQREEDDDDEDEDGGGRRRSKGMRKSGITVGSDEDEEDEEEEEEESEEEQPVRIKRERTAG